MINVQIASLRIKFFFIAPIRLAKGIALLEGVKMQSHELLRNEISSSRHQPVSSGDRNRAIGAAVSPRLA
jgi:hypothetical protein